MDDLQKSARQLRIWSAFLTGCTYGIFLTIGTAWSELVKNVIITLIPNNEDELMQSLVYAASASLVSILILILLVRCDACVERIRAAPISNKLNLKHIRRQRK